MVEVSSAVANGAVETNVARIKKFNLEEYKKSNFDYLKIIY